MDDVRVSWAHEFDCGIIEKTNSPKSPKNYKDHTWESISRSNDPPLKVIRGQLLGPQGIINEIAERYLRYNYPQIWEKQISLQSPVSSDDNKSDTLEDLIEDEIKSPDNCMLDSSDKEYLTRCFHGLLSNENAAIFLIHLTDFSSLFHRKFSLAIPELREYVGLSSSSSIYGRLNNVILPKITSLPEECVQAMRRPGACNFLIFLLVRQIKPEKRALPLLQTVRNGMTTTKKGVRA
ncbi:MAG: hypothetical protein IKO93_04235 [Lentisphaeria bacterium]|nr:hypothetical protein [Lentisphaeria bacterium]